MSVRWFVSEVEVDKVSVFFFFFKQKTAYEIGTGDWSSDVCSSDLLNRKTMKPPISK